MGEIDETTGYNKDERRQGIIRLLSTVLGEDHKIVGELKECLAKQGERHKGKDDYCRHHLMCDICNMQRTRLMNGVFYLAYCKGMDDFYSVTITPRKPIEKLNDCHRVFGKLEGELARRWESFMGCHEIKSTREDARGNSLWPHLHVIATGRMKAKPKRRSRYSQPQPEKEPEFCYKEHKIDLNDIWKYLWHHSKCLPISWFPRKVSSDANHCVDLTCYDLTERQRNDINMFIDQEQVLLKDFQMGMGVFHGVFDFKIYDSPLEYLLRNEKVDRHFVSYKPLLEDRSNLKKVLCYIYLVLCCDVPKGKARSTLRFKGEPDRKRLESIMKEHESKAYEILHWSGLHTWKEPENITGKKKQVLDLAIIEIDQEKIRAKAPVKRERLREILKELGLNTKEQRLFARVANQKNRSNGKTEQPDDHVQQA